ncbi:MAG: type III restriction endonuclease subunit R, partial [bacterium]
FDAEAFADTLPQNAQAAASQMVRIRTGDGADFITEDAVAPPEALAFDAPHAVRMLSDIVPNPYVARELVGRILARLQTRGFTNELIGRLSAFIIDEARKALARWRDGQAALIFAARLNSGQIEFRVRGDAGDWIAPDHIWTTAPENAPQVPSKTGGALERSLFLPVYASDLNDDERQVAVYLDAEAVIKWWHRNGTDRGSYALRGWRRGNVYPDFVFASLRDDAGDRLVAMESKGDQLAGNLDTEYKRQLLDALSKAFGREAVPNDGELPLAARQLEFDAAVVLFSEMNTRLPVLLRGGEESQSPASVN